MKQIGTASPIDTTGLTGDVGASPVTGILWGSPSQQVSIGLCLSWCLGVYCSTGDVLFHVEWCLRHLWSSYIISHNITSTAYNHHTDICSQTYETYTIPPIHIFTSTAEQRPETWYSGGWGRCLWVFVNSGISISISILILILAGWLVGWQWQ